MKLERKIRLWLLSQPRRGSVILPIQKDGPHPVLETLTPCNNAVGTIQGSKSCCPIFPRLAYLLQVRKQGQHCNQREKGELDRSCKCYQVATSDQCCIVSYDPHMAVLITICSCHGFSSLLSWQQLFF